jgi:hypothetical protein
MMLWKGKAGEGFGSWMNMESGDEDQCESELKMASGHPIDLIPRHHFPSFSPLLAEVEQYGLPFKIVYPVINAMGVVGGVGVVGVGGVLADIGP